jgi:uncharacterized protein YdhG (YjbR/CyaY superfamily)
MKTKKTTTFTDEEKSAMKERARELKAGQKADPEAEVLAKIAEMQGLDRELAERIHAIVKATAPTLTPRLWYGSPAYAGEGGKIVCFYQPASKFKTRYATLGFSDNAKLDDGAFWPSAYALTRLTADDEARLAALITRAVG